MTHSISSRPAAHSMNASPVLESLQAARNVLKQDRRAGWAALNALFGGGTAPEPALDGRYDGELLALDVAPGLTQVAGALASAWMPWLGKTFDTAGGRGDNVFGRDSLLLSRLYWPLYRGYREDGAQTYRAFAFRIYQDAGLADPGLTVLKIDYDLPENPRLSIRRVLDELVQLAPGLYLGKAHLLWWWGRWQTVAYFSLSSHPIA